MPDRSALITDLRAASAGSADLDLRVGQAIGVVPGDAVFDFDGAESWITPARAEWREATFIAANNRMGGMLDVVDPPPVPAKGNRGWVVQYTRSLDAIVPYILSLGLTASIGFSGDTATANIHGGCAVTVTGGEHKGPRALCAALLEYREATNG